MAAMSITEGVIWQQILWFFFPILFGTFFQQLYNTADAVIVGRFVNKEALAAVGGSTALLTNLLVGFFVGLSSGISVLVSQFYGAKNARRLEEVVHTGVIFSVISGLLITALGLFLARPALELMGTPADTMEQSLEYLNIYLTGITFNIIYNVGAGILRAVGDSRRPLWFLMVSCLVNIVLDVLFVLGFRMGVRGAAFATVISEIVSAALAMSVLWKSSDIYRLQSGKFKLNMYMVRRILVIGIPTGMQAVLYSISNMTIQSSVNALGTDTVAAWAAYAKIDSVYWMVINALGIACTTFAGQNYGAGRIDRVKKGTRECLGFGAAIAVGLSTLLYAVGRIVFSLFTTDDEVVRIGMEILHFLAPCFILYVAIEIFSGTLRGVGDSFFAMIATGLGVCVLRVVWILIAVPHRPGILTILFSYPLSWGLTSLIFLMYYLYFSPLKIADVKGIVIKRKRRGTARRR